MAAFEIKWLADGAVLSKMFFAKRLEDKLNELRIAPFNEEDILVRRVVIFFQVLQDMSLSRRENKAKLNPKKQQLELTLDIDYGELMSADDEETKQLMMEALLFGIHDLIDVDGFDNFGLFDAVEALLTEPAQT